MELLETYENATKEDRTAALEGLGLRLTAVFVPWSQSRNAGEKERSLNWRVKLFRGDREIIETDYMQGIGHAPSYQFRQTIHSKEATDFESETGRRFHEGTTVVLNGRPLDSPALLDVCYSLGIDAQVGSVPFEEFCADFGYNPDSRKARKLWKSGQKTAYKLGRELAESINRVCEGY